MGTRPLPEVTPALMPALCCAGAGSQHRCSLGTALWLRAGERWLCPPAPAPVLSSERLVVAWWPRSQSLVSGAGIWPWLGGRNVPPRRAPGSHGTSGLAGAPPGQLGAGGAGAGQCQLQPAAWFGLPCGRHAHALLRGARMEMWGACCARGSWCPPSRWTHSPWEQGGFLEVGMAPAPSREATIPALG